jgi:hypothetical protein
MSVTTTTPPRPGAMARTVSDVAVITRRNLLRTVRLPDVLVLSATMPVIFIVMFTHVFGGAIQGALPPAAAGSYVNWLLPGLLAQFALFGGGATASGLVEDLAKGVIDRFRSLPMARSAVLAGRTLSDLVRSALTLTLMLAVGFGMGFRPQTSLLGLPAALAVRHRGHQRAAGPDPRPGRPATRPDRHRADRPHPALGGRHHRRLRAAGRPRLPPHGQLTLAQHPGRTPSQQLAAAGDDTRGALWQRPTSITSQWFDSAASDRSGPQPESSSQACCLAA